MITLSFFDYGFILFISMAITWILSQGLKVFTAEKKTFQHIFYVSGTGPSSHVAPLITLATMIFLHDGFSPLFVLSFALLAIVLRDSLGVRFASGKNAEILRDSLKGKKLAKEVIIERGHTVKEIVAAVLIGLIVALSMSVWFL